MTLYGWLCRYYALDVDWTIIAVPTKFLDILSIFKENMCIQGYRTHQRARADTP